eukprot:scaffold19787_cov27-Tisochrysis_lutea.AAC.3
MGEPSINFNCGREERGRESDAIARALRRRSAEPEIGGGGPRIILAEMSHSYNAYNNRLLSSSNLFSLSRERKGRCQVRLDRASEKGAGATDGRRASQDAAGRDRTGAEDSGGIGGGRVLGRVRHKINYTGGDGADGSKARQHSPG